MIPLENKLIRGPAVVAAVAMLLLALALAKTTKSIPYGEFHHDLTDPVLAIELANTQPEVKAILNVDPTHKVDVPGDLRGNTVWDLAFILAYAAFFWLVTGSIARPALRLPVRVLILVTAAADYAEDWGIFHTVDSGHVVNSTHLASLVKWACLSLILLLIALQLATTRLRPFERTFTGLLTIVVFLAGVTGLTGLGNSPESFLPGVFSYRHLELTVRLAAALPLAYIVGSVLAWRGVLMHDSPPLVPETDDPPQVLGPHT